jgi:hypothetical protein
MGGTGATGGTGGTDSTACPTGPMYWEFLENNPDGDDLPLEGVRSCLAYAGTEECVVSNAQGKLVHNHPPANVEYTFTHQKEGYEGMVFGGFQGVNPFGGLRCTEPLVSTWLYRDDDPERQALAAQLDAPYPSERGIVALIVHGPDTYVNFAGVSFVPVDSTAGEVGEVFYCDTATGQYSLDLDETAACPEAWPLLILQGQGGFTEVTPGVQEFEVTGAVGDCYGPGFGWPSDAPNRIRVPVRAGFRTWGTVQCDPP